MIKEKKRGLTSYEIKLIALVFMVLDHIYTYFSFTGLIPLAFKWLGRISAPLFLFMTVEGYYHTSNFFRYANRLYTASVLMAAGSFLVNYFFTRSDDIILLHNMFATMFLLLIHLKIWDSLDEAIKSKKTKLVFARLSLLFVPTAISFLLLMLIPKLPNFLANMIMILFPNVFLAEGGLVFITLGISLYAFRSNPKLQMIIYAILSLSLMPKLGFSIKVFLYQDFQWMMVFALPFIYAYNGQKGKDNKSFFYLFYPIHVYLLFIISSILMK